MNFCALVRHEVIPVGFKGHLTSALSIYICAFYSRFSLCLSTSTTLSPALRLFMCISPLSFPSFLSFYFVPSIPLSPFFLPITLALYRSLALSLSLSCSLSFLLFLSLSLSLSFPLSLSLSLSPSISVSVSDSLSLYMYIYLSPFVSFLPYLYHCTSINIYHYIYIPMSMANPFLYVWCISTPTPNQLPLTFSSWSNVLFLFSRNTRATSHTFYHLFPIFLCFRFWYKEKPSQCPYEDPDTHVCSTLVANNFTCVEVDCCRNFDERDGALEYDGDYSDEEEDDKIYYYGQLEGTCRSVIYIRIKGIFKAKGSYLMRY